MLDNCLIKTYEYGYKELSTINRNANIVLFFNNYHFFLYYSFMADGIEIESFGIPEGISDTDLQNVFFSGSVADVLAKFGQQLQGDLRNSLDAKGKNATNELGQSITFNVEVFGGEFQFSLSMAKYWRWVDEGRKAGKQPPIEPIKKWVKVKSVFGGLPTENQDGVAFAIARKIGKFGIKPSNFFTDVIGDGRLQKLQEDLARAAQDDITSIIFKT